MFREDVITQLRWGLHQKMLNFLKVCNVKNPIDFGPRNRCFYSKMWFPCIKSEKRNSMWHGESKQRGKVRREGPVNHRIWPGIKACSCGRVDRFPALNGKSQCSKRWCGCSVRALLLQKWYEITFPSKMLICLPLFKYVRTTLFANIQIFETVTFPNWTFQNWSFQNSEL